MAITKTDFMRGMQCPKMLWLDKHKPGLKVIPPEIQAKLDAGNDFGDRAMGMFDPYEEIKTLRNEACAVFIRNIPAYAKQEGGSVKDYLIRLSGAVPPENCDRYGLTAFVEEYRTEKTE